MEIQLEEFNGMFNSTPFFSLGCLYCPWCDCDEVLPWFVKLQPLQPESLKVLELGIPYEQVFKSSPKKPYSTQHKTHRIFYWKDFPCFLLFCFQLLNGLPRSTQTTHTHTLDKATVSEFHMMGSVQTILMLLLQRPKTIQVEHKFSRVASFLFLEGYGNWTSSSSYVEQMQVREIDPTSYPDSITGALFTTAKWCVPSPPLLLKTVSLHLQSSNILS